MIDTAQSLLDTGNAPSYAGAAGGGPINAAASRPSRAAGVSVGNYCRGGCHQSSLHSAHRVPSGHDSNAGRVALAHHPGHPSDRSQPGPRRVLPEAVWAVPLGLLGLPDFEAIPRVSSALVGRYSPRSSMKENFLLCKGSRHTPHTNLVNGKGNTADTPASGRQKHG